jgi:DNA-binding transcriptional LysR family regulator
MQRAPEHRRRTRRVARIPGQRLIQIRLDAVEAGRLEALLESGLAVAIAFKLGTYRGRDRKLVFRPLIEPSLTRTICLVTHAERALSPAASALIKATIDHLHRRTDGFRLQRRASA